MSIVTVSFFSLSHCPPKSWEVVRLCDKVRYGAFSYAGFILRVPCNIDRKCSELYETYSAMPVVDYGACDVSLWILQEV